MVERNSRYLDLASSFSVGASNADFLAGVNDRSAQNILLGLPSVAKGPETTAFGGLISKEGDPLLQASASVVTAYFVQIGLHLRFLKARTFSNTSAPVGAIEYISRKSNGEDTWLGLLRKAVVKDLEQVPSDIDLPRTSILVGANRLDGEKLSVESIEEIIKLVLAVNNGNFFSRDLDLIGIIHDVRKVYPRKYKGLREKFGLPENSVGDASPRINEPVRLNLPGNVSDSRRSAEVIIITEPKKNDIAPQPSEADIRNTLIADLRRQLENVPKEILASGLFFGFYDAGFGNLATAILKLGKPTFEANLAELLKGDSDSGTSET